jgi:putative RecB family exonuclease
MVPALSPSRASDFKQCPLLYRFRAVDKLPAPPSPAAARGTLVHAVLERLFDLPAEQRTPTAAAELVGPQWERLVLEEPELAEMIAGDEQRTVESWFGEANALIETWFDLEDPTRLEPAERELYVETDLDGLVLRGYVDRLDVAPDGAMRVVDYKTGRSPSELFEGKALFQMKFYALVLWRLRGEIPRLLQLVYLGNGEVVRYSPDEHDLLSLERNLKAVWTAIERAATTGDWRPKTSKLCDWCDYREFCPAWGGTPPPLPDNAAQIALDPGVSGQVVPADDCRATSRASEARSVGVRPRRLGTWTAPAVMGTGTTCGTAIVGTPAATAERTPVGESSMATQSAASTPRERAAAK